MAKNDPSSDSHAENCRLYTQAWGSGTREFAGHVVMRIDRMMEGGLDHRDQEILYRLRKEISTEIGRRFPGFDLDEEARRHA